jgi:hypothetical protein
VAASSILFSSSTFRFASFFRSSVRRSIWDQCYNHDFKRF